MKSAHYRIAYIYYIAKAFKMQVIYTKFLEKFIISE